MKKTTIGFAVFVVSFLMGFLAVLPLIGPLASIPIVTLDQPFREPVGHSEILPAVEEDFEAEYDPEKKSKRPVRRNLVWVSSFHSEFFPYKNGESWFGLFKEGDNFVIRRTDLKVSKLKKPELYDIETTTNRKGKSVFLVRGLPYLRESTIPTLFDAVVDDEKRETLSLVPRRFEYEGQHYSLFVENRGRDDWLGKGSKLVIESTGIRQTLRYIPNGCNDCYWTLLWVGDLDLDGKLDFHIDLTSHYNREDRVLFLSSPAGEGKLVKHVADFYSVGC